MPFRKSQIFAVFSLLFFILLWLTACTTVLAQDHTRSDLNQLNEEQEAQEELVKTKPELFGANSGFDSRLPIDAEDQKSFLFSFFMIIFSEIGDKTFLIAAVMAMQHSRLVVFTAAFFSLIVMSVLSAVLGYAIPNLISRVYTNYLAAILFFVFGIKMAQEGWNMSADETQQELEEVDAELREKQEVKQMGTIEGGGVIEEKKKGGCIEGLSNLCQLLFSPVFVQTFILTFLGEWGDRSQIATIALAASQDVYFVTLGTIMGHSLCTALAVIGGRMLAQKISLKTVTIAGAVIFVAFAFIYLYEALYEKDAQL